MRKHIFIFLAASLLLPVFSGETPGTQFRELTISKTTSQNPSIWFAGIPGNSELTTAINRFLAACGWFDCVRDRKAADYTLEGKDEGKTFLLYLKMGGASAGAWRFSKGSSSRSSAKSAVDTIIEKSFKELKVKGFCRSKIAFCARTAYYCLVLCGVFVGEHSICSRLRRHL